MADTQPLDPADEDAQGLACCLLCRGGELTCFDQPCGPNCCTVVCPWCGNQGMLLGNDTGGVTDLCGKPLGPVSSAMVHAMGGRYVWAERYLALFAETTAS